MAKRKMPSHHEPADFDARRILYIGCGLLLAVAVLSAILLAVIGHPHSAQRNAQFGSDADTPHPHLQMKPLDDYATFHDEKQAMLSGCSWIDRNAGTVRIPIDRAMDIVAERATKPARPQP